MKTTIVECTPETVAKLLTEVKELKNLLWHVMYRSHPHSPTFCSPCEQVQQVLNEGTNYEGSK